MYQMYLYGIEKGENTQETVMTPVSILKGAGGGVSIPTDCWDISTIVRDITFESSINGQAGKLTFGMNFDETDDLQVAVGMEVQFWNNENNIFVGKIFNVRTDGKTVNVLAYDKLRYLKNPINLMIKEGDNFVQVIQSALAQAYIRIGEYRFDGWLRNNYEQLPSMPQQVYIDKPCYTVIMDCIRRMNEYFVSKRDKGGKVEYDAMGEFKYDPERIRNIRKFFLRVENGIIVFSDIGYNVLLRETNLPAKSVSEIDKVNKFAMGTDYTQTLKVSETQPLVIGDKSLLTGYDYEIDIDKNTYTSVVGYNRDIMNEVKKVDGKYGFTEYNKGIAEITVPDQMSKYGLLRRTSWLKGKGITADMVKEYLELAAANTAYPSKTMRLEALGYNGLLAGDGFWLEIEKLGVRQMVYVVSVTHRYDMDKHTMSLEVMPHMKFMEEVG